MSEPTRHARGVTRRSPSAIAGSVLVACTVLVAATAGCGRGAGAVEAHASATRVAPNGVDPAVAAAAIDGLAIDLYRQLAPTAGNLVFSPYSVEVAVAMARHGARGTTRQQMDAVLHSGSGPELDQSLNLIDQELAKRVGHRERDERKGEVELSPANSLWGQDGFPFDPSFLDLLAMYYGAGVKTVDFQHDWDAARREINAWTSDRTNAKIADLLPSGSLDDFTRLVLVNAIYLKAPWAKRFSPMPNTPFTRSDGSTVGVDAMTVGRIGTAGRGPGWQAAEIPYLGDELSMVVIMPDDLDSFERSLDGNGLGAILAGVTQPMASLTMPKFSFNVAKPLKEPLAALGMPDAFDRDRADFTGMTTDHQHLFIDDAYHQAFIGVDEEGTEAAAATAVVMELTSGPAGANVRIDHPFLFAIRDVATNTVLFFGRVSDPATRSG